MKGFLAVALAMVLAEPTLANPPAVHVSGGGTATFDFLPGGTTFSVQVAIDAGSGVRGHFFCAIPGIVTIVGDDLEVAHVNDDGSVTPYGLAHGFDAAVGVYEDMPFAVQLWAGGAGVGAFLYDDPVVGPSGGVNLAEGDHETVSAGRIAITFR